MVAGRLHTETAANSAHRAGVTEVVEAHRSDFMEPPP